MAFLPTSIRCCCMPAVLPVRQPSWSVCYATVYALPYIFPIPISILNRSLIFESMSLSAFCNSRMCPTWKTSTTMLLEKAIAGLKMSRKEDHAVRCVSSIGCIMQPAMPRRMVSSGLLLRWLPRAGRTSDRQTAGMVAVSDCPDVEWWSQNWRKGGLQLRRSELLRLNEFYNQLYCGCEFSLAASKAHAESGRVILLTAIHEKLFMTSL